MYSHRADITMLKESVWVEMLTNTHKARSPPSLWGWQS